MFIKHFAKIYAYEIKGQTKNRSIAMLDFAQMDHPYLYENI